MCSNESTNGDDSSSSGYLDDDDDTSSNASTVYVHANHPHVIMALKHDLAQAVEILLNAGGRLSDQQRAKSEAADSVDKLMLELLVMRCRVARAVRLAEYYYERRATVEEGG
ncbi:hypothetical protein FN846DRAFT_889927 [Sphaerosporella brunnea]|uniref:Uncharacterized protein n=1 Tax=Sphaerosporella brunnea TaxID=1250544 RepID=A0A5J5EYC3_9PEZI|nr:hypothetical protein FN846DRAFT_889927 [Sphaerosporella brunnea]